MLRRIRFFGCTSAAVLLLALAAGANAQGEGGPGVTRLLLTQVRVKPSQADTWRALQREQVVLKRVLSY